MIGNSLIVFIYSVCISFPWNHYRFESWKIPSHLLLSYQCMVKYWHTLVRCLRCFQYNMLYLIMKSSFDWLGFWTPDTCRSWDWRLSAHFSILTIFSSVTNDKRKAVFLWLSIKTEKTKKLFYTFLQKDSQAKHTSMLAVERLFIMAPLVYSTLVAQVTLGIGWRDTMRTTKLVALPSLILSKLPLKF